VEHEWVIDALRLVIGIVILGYASVKDMRERKVPNAPWIVLAVTALILLPVQVVADGESLSYLLIMVPILAIFADVYWDGKEGSAVARYGPAAKYSIGIIALVALGYTWGTNSYFQHLLAVPVMMLFIVAMYLTDLIRGGADAKALLSLAVLFPIYPVLGGFPLFQGGTPAVQLLFPFVFVILIYASIANSLLFIYFLLRNVASGDLKLPQALLGFKLDHSKITGRHVWLMERIEDGEHVVYVRPRHEENLEKEVDLLVASGHTRLWVTPMTPLVLLMWASLIFSSIFGNLIFWLVSL
jgi:preflagellin peptidase FlaK